MSLNFGRHIGVQLSADLWGEGGRGRGRREGRKEGGGEEGRGRGGRRRKRTKEGGRWRKCKRRKSFFAHVLHSLKHVYTIYVPEAG